MLRRLGWLSGRGGSLDSDARRGSGRRKATPYGIRITKLGAAFVGLIVVLVLAAVNTGNNALFLVFGQMLALFAISGWLSHTNLMRLVTHLDLPSEIYARRPLWGRVEVENRGKRWPRRWLTVRVQDASEDGFCDLLAPGERRTLDLRLMFRRRGHHDVDAVVISSLFPFGFFRKGMRLRLSNPLLVYPEIYPEGGSIHPESGRLGDRSQAARGEGPELRSLRPYRPGDDPRRIHWKKTAHSGEIVVLEREAEGGHRFTVLFDNGVGELVTDADRQRFESLVSEAATAVHNYLREGFEVELVTRDRRFAASQGRRHQELLLTHLALVEPVEVSEGAGPLTSSLQDAAAAGRGLRLAMSRGSELSIEPAGGSSDSTAS